MAHDEAVATDAGGEDRPRISKYSAQNGFTDLIEGVFYAVAMSIVGVFTTTLALIVRPKTFLPGIRGENAPGTPLDLSPAAYFLSTVVVFIFTFWYTTVAESAFNGVDHADVPKWFTDAIGEVSSGNLNSLLARVSPIIIAAIILSIGLRIAVFLFRGKGRFDMALRVCLYALGVLFMVISIGIVCIGVGYAMGLSGDAVFAAPGIIFLIAPFLFCRVLFSLTRRGFHMGRLRGVAVLLVSFVIWGGALVSFAVVSEPMLQTLNEEPPNAVSENPK